MIFLSEYCLWNQLKFVLKHFNCIWNFLDLIFAEIFIFSSDLKVHFQRVEFIQQIDIEFHRIF